MENPDAWWGHVPVISQSYSRNLGEYWNWHKVQLDEALAKVTDRYPAALHMIPASGFYIMAGRSIQKHKNGEPDDLLLAVTIWEDDDGLTYPKNAGASIVVRGGVAHQELASLGSPENPFIQLFDNLVQNAPREWPEFLRSRRRLRCKPVPEWLLKLRLEDRKKSRKKTRLPSEP